jgi:hypothetical protein
MDLVDSIIIDGKDKRTSSNSTTDFTIDIQRPGRNVSIVEIRKIEIPLSYDNVNSSNNVITIGGTPYTIPAGLYDITGLIQELGAQVSGSYNVTYENNNRITIDNGGGANFIILPGISAELFGFDSSATYSGSNTYTTPFFPNLIQDHEYFTLHSKVLSNKGDTVHHTDKRSDIIAFIPIKEDLGTSFSWEPKRRKLIKTRDMHISLVDFTLRNRAGNVVDLDNKTFQLVLNRYHK